MKTSTLNPSALAFYLSAHEGARQDFDNLRYELDALRRLVKRGAKLLSGIEASPLEAPYGDGGPFTDALRRLRQSALVLAPPIDGEAHFDNNPNEARIDRIGDVYGRALALFEPLRFPPEPNNPFATQRADGRPYQRRRLPASVHKEARRMYVAVLCPLDFDISEAPRLAALDEARIWPQAPLDDAHRAAIAALACLSCAVELLGSILTLWRDRFAEPGVRLHLEGHAGTEAWVGAVGAIRGKPKDLALEMKAYGDASRWVDSADAWLNLGEQAHQAEANTREVVQRAAAERRDAHRLASQEGAKKRIESSESTWKVNRRRIAAAWRRLLPEQQSGSGAVALICRQLNFELSAPTVRDHLRRLGHLPTAKQKGKSGP